MTPNHPSRHIVFVDTETNGLNPSRHAVVEAAWWNLATDERGLFIPKHSWRHVLAEADLPALRVNGYIDRIAGKPQDTTGAETVRLWEQFGGPLASPTPAEDRPEDRPADRHVLAAFNPAFDAAMIANLFRSTPAISDACLDETPWHYRLLDVSAFAAGVLGLPDMPSAAKTAELLGIDPGDHSAEADVTAGGLCLLALFAKAGLSMTPVGV